MGSLLKRHSAMLRTGCWSGRRHLMSGWRSWGTSPASSAGQACGINWEQDHGVLREGKKAHLLLETIFGDSLPLSSPASRSSIGQIGEKRDKPGINSDRLLTWAEAFDEWLRELGAKYTQSTTKQARLAWRRLLQNQGSYPWALAEEVIRTYAAWMGTEDKLYSKCNSSIPNGTIALLV